jgi:DNA polymerase/3'-5' exonuclease PolX
MIFARIKTIDELLKIAEKSINKEIAILLRELARLQDNVWKGTAYSRAAENIENLDESITEIENLEEIPGIGHDIALEIKEYIETGSIQKLERFKKEEEGKGKFSREQALQLSGDLFEAADSTGLTYKITGSIRRKVPKVKDIDVVIVSEEFDSWEYFVESISDKILRKGEQEIDFNYNGIDINIRAVPKEEFGAGILYFTGPRSFEIFLRQEAKKKGYKLNRHGLFDSEGKHIVKTEKDIFKKLDIPYIEPEER